MTTTLTASTTTDAPPGTGPARGPGLPCGPLLAGTAVPTLWGSVRLGEQLILQPPKRARRTGGLLLTDPATPGELITADKPWPPSGSWPVGEALPDCRPWSLRVPQALMGDGLGLHPALSPVVALLANPRALAGRGDPGHDLATLMFRFQQSQTPACAAAGRGDVRGRAGPWESTNDCAGSCSAAVAVGFLHLRKESAGLPSCSWLRGSQCWRYSRQRIAMLLSAAAAILVAGGWQGGQPRG